MHLFASAFSSWLSVMATLSENISKLQAHKADILLLHDAYDFLFGKSRRFCHFCHSAFPHTKFCKPYGAALKRKRSNRCLERLSRKADFLCNTGIIIPFLK